MGSHPPVPPIVCVVGFHHARSVPSVIGLLQTQSDRSAGAPRWKPGLESAMAPIPPQRMSGRCCPSSPSPTARIRESESGLLLACADCLSSSIEECSYFTLRKEASAERPATSLFGIACTRQIDASTLVNRPSDVTRSTVQKAVVVISESPQHFGQLREKLSIITKAWFAQRWVVCVPAGCID